MYAITAYRGSPFLEGERSTALKGSSHTPEGPGERGVIKEEVRQRMRRGEGWDREYEMMASNW